MKVLIIDDTTLFRKIISDSISSDPDIEIVGRARNGVVGLELIRNVKPDIITLDLDMPEMDGIEVLEHIQKEELNVGVIVISAQTTSGSIKTIEALQKGAFDFITKPNEDSMEKNMAQLKGTLIPMFKAWMSKHIQTIPTNGNGYESTLSKVKISDLQNVPLKPEFVAIGISTGGPESLRSILPKIPKEFSLPILIVQHMPAVFTKSMADMLDKICELHIKEAENSEEIKAGTVYIAPGGYHMKVINLSGIARIKITEEPPENHCKPSVNHLFRSLSNNYPGRTLAVIMTGMGNDGLLGMKLLKRHSCISIAQDKSTSVVFGMPKVVIDAGLSDVVARLDQISDLIVRVGSSD